MQNAELPAAILTQRSFFLEYSRMEMQKSEARLVKRLQDRERGGPLETHKGRWSEYQDLGAAEGSGLSQRAAN